MAGKKGLSPIIATVALILLTVAAVGFIAGYLIPFTKERLYGSTECVDYKQYYTFYDEFEYNCYVNTSNYFLYGVSIQADSTNEAIAQKINGFKLQFLNEGESQPVDVIDASLALGSEGNIRMLNASKSSLEIPKEGEVKTYVYNSSIRFTRIRISPVLKSGRVCDETDTARIEYLCLKNLTS
jgi:flagellin-like protein